MGCSHSIPDNHPTMFKASNVNDKDKLVNSVVLEVQNTKLIVHSRSRKVMASWPIRCLRKYGCNNDNLFFIEAGSGCDTGQGMYLFKCARTEQLFDLLKRHWDEIQRSEQSCGLMQPMRVNPLPNQTVITTSNQNQQYYNMNNSSVTNHVTASDANYMNGCVRLPSASSATQVLPATPTTNGSASSQHAGMTLASLPEESSLRLDLSDPPFALQPAPTCRKEMINRRRINSEMPVASYSRTTDSVSIGNPRRRNSETANYENNEVLHETSSSFPRPHRVSYSKKKQKVQLEHTASGASDSGVSPQTSSNASTLVSPDGLDALKADCEPLLTPSSKSSGIGSLNGNGAVPHSSHPPPVVPPPLSDPWKRHPSKYGRHRVSPTSYVPQSARDYVNTANASMDVSGTPLPATAVGGMHFSFDFDWLGLPHRSRSAAADRARLNYVPVEIVKNSDGDFNCGASSASSGITGTPRTPKTPLSHQPTDYAIIDHNKTRALSNAHRARQRDLKSRHTNTEIAVLNAV